MTAETPKIKKSREEMRFDREAKALQKNLEKRKLQQKKREQQKEQQANCQSAQD